MTRLTRAIVAVSVVAVVGLAGCGGTNPAPTSSSSATSDSPGPSPRPTSAAPTALATSDGMPEGAKAKTPEGAMAFVHHFIGAQGRAWTEPNDKILPQLCVPSGTTCAGWEDAAKELVAKKQRFDRAPVTATKVTQIGEIPAGALRFNMTGTQNAARIVDAQGNVVQRIDRADISFEYHVVWTDGSWKILDVFKGQR